MVYQDPESQLFATTVEDEVAFGPENLGLPRGEIRERVEWALAAVGHGRPAPPPPAHLSGGQQQRVAIAASLAMLPEVLILDEPTAALDPLGQHEVFGVIEALCRERRMTIVMVSGDAERVAQFSDRVAVLWEGRIARADTPAAVFHDTDLVAASGYCRAPGERRGRGAEPAPRRRTPLRAPGGGRRRASTRATRGSGGCGVSAAMAAVVAEGLVYHYEEGVPALGGVDLTVADNAYLAVVGQNGSGKTTLVKHFNGLLRPSAGCVRVLGRDTRQATVTQLAQQVGYVFQNPDHQIFAPQCARRWPLARGNLG